MVLSGDEGFWVVYGVVFFLSWHGVVCCETVQGEVGSCRLDVWWFRNKILRRAISRNSTL